MKKIDTVRQKLKNIKTNIDTINIAYNIDSSKNKKYIEHLVRLRSDLLDDLERCVNDEMYVLFSLLLKFDELATNGLIENPDLNQYSTIQSIREAIEDGTINKTASKAKKEIKILFEDDKYKLFIPLSHDAAALYGKGTKWCITQNEYFFRYSDKGIIYFFVDKEKNRKIAVFYDFGESFYYSYLTKKENQSKGLIGELDREPIIRDKEMNEIYMFSIKFSCWTDWDDKIDMLFAPIPNFIKDIIINFSKENKQSASFFNEQEINNLISFYDEQVKIKNDMSEPYQPEAVFINEEYEGEMMLL